MKDRPEKGPYERHVKTWRVLYAIAHGYICRKFNLVHEDLNVDGPVLIIPNHVTNWDPLLVAMSLKKKHVYFVATEHLFRLGFPSKLLRYFLAPIARPKGGSGLETVRNCVEHLRKGHSVCLFAEGEATWDGLTHPIFPATGKLVKMSGASLVTYRLEGAYLSLPRWRKTVRRGKVFGHPVHVYSPEDLAKMSPHEINDAINRDIREDAWEREKEEKTVYCGKAPAKGLERALYLCPACKKIGTLHTENDRIFCSCGLQLQYSETGFSSLESAAGAPTPSASLKTCAEWIGWQEGALREVFTQAGRDPSRFASPLFSDGGLTLLSVSNDHSQTVLSAGTLSQFPDRLVFEDRTFPLSSIDSMAMVQTNRLLFTVKNAYYEIVSDKHSLTNLKKYLDCQAFSQKD